MLLLDSPLGTVNTRGPDTGLLQVCLPGIKKTTWEYSREVVMLLLWIIQQAARINISCTRTCRRRITAHDNHQQNGW